MLLNATASGTTIGLQRGRALSSAEIWLLRAMRLALRSASTGPRSFERGDHVNTSLARAHPRTLQRGRALSSAEMARLAAGSRWRRWLQRGRALSSAEMGLHLRGVGHIRPASTGPRSFERGDGSWPGEGGGGGAASTGPRSFERGDCTLVSVWTAVAIQMESERVYEHAVLQVAVGHCSHANPLDTNMRAVGRFSASPCRSRGSVKEREIGVSTREIESACGQRHELMRQNRGDRAEHSFVQAT